MLSRTGLTAATMAMAVIGACAVEPQVEEAVVVIEEPVIVEPPVITQPTVVIPDIPTGSVRPDVIEEAVVSAGGSGGLFIPGLEQSGSGFSGALVGGGVTTASVDTPLVSAPAIRASRSFAGPTQFPPENFAAYGILAFPDDPSSSETLSTRFDLFCKAFMGGISTVEELVISGVRIDAQMVTVVPVDSNAVSEAARTAANSTAACAIARENYGNLAARTSIIEANRAPELTDGVDRLDGRGPFLIAWSPGETKGSNDAIVLVTDLTNSVSEEQITSDIRLWVETIQQNPDLWRRGWNLEGLRLAGQRWIDRRAAGILKILGGGS